MSLEELNQDPWMVFLSLAMAIAMGAWTYLDAKELQDRGATVLPGVWALMVFLICGIGLPFYLLLRSAVWRRQVDDLAGEGGGDDPGD
ncbi:MAG: hypothetical protein AAGD01_04840 [Acidobacteriota bacterium]